MSVEAFYNVQQAPIATNHATPNIYSAELEKLCARGGYCICDLRESLGHCLLEFSTFPNTNSPGSWLLAQRSLAGLEL